MPGVIHGTEFLRVLLCFIGACLFNVSVKKDFHTYIHSGSITLFKCKLTTFLFKKYYL